MIRRIKNFIHKHETLKRLIFSLLSIFWIVRARPIFKKIKHSSVAKNNFKVVILALRTFPFTNLVYFDAVFGHAFKKLGCDVKMLYCDGALDSCDADTVFRNQKAQCFVCQKFGKEVKDVLNLDCLSYSQYISEADIEEIKTRVANLNAQELLNYNYLGINIGKHAQASAIRYFLFGEIGLTDPIQATLFKKKLVYAMIAAKIAQALIEKENPDAILMVHGVYSTWGPFSEYFRLKGIETIVYGNMPPRFGHFIFNHNNKANEIVSKKAWLGFSQTPFKEEKEKRINDYLERRTKGKIGDQEMYKNNFDKKSKESILKLLSGNKYKKRFVIYPNLAWDVGIEGKISEIFEDVFDWIDRTIEFFRQKKDYQLVIKPHPAELVWDKCSKGIAEYIKEKYHPLPENIILLEANVPLNAYDLVDNNSVALVYNGTVGLELAALGIPVLAVTHIHYREAGVVKKIDTLDEYLKLLDNPEELVSFARDNAELAKKYAYFYFFKSMVRIPFYRDDKWSVLDWNKLRKPKELFSEESNIIKICKRIINKQDVVYPL